MKHHLLVALALSTALSGCGRSDAPKAPQDRPERQAPVKYDPAFRNLSGTWTSAPDAIRKGYVLQVDIASAGDYSIDVRTSGMPLKIDETGSGKATIRDGAITSSPSPDTHGRNLSALGSWTAAYDGKDGMTLSGADGRRVAMTRQAR